MKLHVTGGSGFLGAHVVALLRTRGHHVMAMARTPTAAQRVADLGAEPIQADLDDPSSIVAAFERGAPDGLVNLASLGFGHAPAIVGAAEQAGLKRALFVSTTAVFTKLPAPSKRVRLAAEDAIMSSALDWTIVRPTMIYGTPGDRNMARLLATLKRVPVMALPGGGRKMQQPVHVEDLAAAVVAAIETPVAVRRVYDIAGPEPLSFRRVVEEAARAVGKRPVLIPVPLTPLIAGVRVYERRAANPRLKAEQLERLAEDKAFDIEAARVDLGYDPRSFRVGIEQEAALLA